jgi:hypothetical protein
MSGVAEQLLSSVRTIHEEELQHDRSRHFSHPDLGHIAESGTL